MKLSILLTGFITTVAYGQYANFNELNPTIYSFAYHDNKIVVGQDYKVTQLDSTNLTTLPVDNKKVLAVEYSLDGSWVAAAGTDLELLLWNPSTTQVKKFNTSEDAILSIKFINDHLLVTGGSGRTLKIWDFQKDLLLFELKSHQNDITSIEVLVEDNAIFSIDGDGYLYIWNLNNSELISSIKVGNNWLRDLDLDPVKKEVAISGDHSKITIVDIKDFSFPIIKGKVGSASNWITTLEFNGAGDALVYGGHDNIVRVWTPFGIYKKKLKSYIVGATFIDKNKIITSTKNSGIYLLRLVDMKIGKIK